MGGFIAAKIFNVRDVESFTVINGKVNIEFKPWALSPKFDIVKNGIEASAPCVSSKSGNLYHVDITIEIKEFNSSTYTSFNKFLSILALPAGEMHGFGTPDFPLSMSTEPIYSKTPSGRSGGLIKMTGKQPNNVLIL